MKLETTTFDSNARIPAKNAFCDYGDPVSMSDNVNPDFSWSDLPDGTLSLVMVCHDSSVPSRGDDVNQSDREVPADLPRVDFYHWVLVDVQPNSKIESGSFSDGVTPRGKEGPSGPFGTRQGINNYTDWFKGDADMDGTYFGYDGPAPPWNDSIVHQYHFTLYALDCDRCPVEGTFTGDDVLKAIEGHVLGSDSITGTYSLNQRLRS